MVQSHEQEGNESEMSLLSNYNDQEFDEKSTKIPYQANRRHRLIFCAVASAFLGAMTLVVLWLYILDPTRQVSNCGISAEEARSLGCRYDPMSFAWLPANCYDEELTKEFLLHDWQWYTDMSGKISVSQTQVLDGVFDQLFVTWEYHLTHCVFMWRKMARAVESNKILDGYIADMGHTKHCEMMLLSNGIPRNQTTTMIYTKFADCNAKYRGRGHSAWYRVVDGKKVFSLPHGD